MVVMRGGGPGIGGLQRTAKRQVGVAVRRKREIYKPYDGGCRASTRDVYNETTTTCSLSWVAETAAKAGADVVMRALKEEKGVIEQKSNTADLVTVTDRKAEAAILDILREHVPHHAVLGEEGGVRGDSSQGRVEGAYLWAVDPLDGTTNFLNNYPSFATSVACLKEGICVAACVVEFTGGVHCWGRRTYTAERGQGATCNGQKLVVSDTDDISNSLLVTGFGYEHGSIWRKNMELFKHFTDKTRGVRRLGAAAVDLCHVALGICDGYWEFDCKVWDWAAGSLIVEESGGRVTTLEGKKWSPFDRHIVASNGKLHSCLIEETKKAVVELKEEGCDLGPWYVPEGYKYIPDSESN